MSNAEEILNVYCSDLVEGYGRFIIITTSQFYKNGKDIISEVFIFGLDQDFFQGQVIHYHYHEGDDEMIVPIDFSYMEKEATSQARNIINKLQHDYYQKNKDIDAMSRNFDFHKIEEINISQLRTRKSYVVNIQDIFRKTNSNRLKDYLTLILSLNGKIIISQYK